MTLLVNYWLIEEHAGDTSESSSTAAGVGVAGPPKAPCCIVPSDQFAARLDQVGKAAVAGLEGPGPGGGAGEPGRVGPAVVDLASRRENDLEEMSTDVVVSPNHALATSFYIPADARGELRAAALVTLSGMGRVRLMQSMFDG